MLNLSGRCTEVTTMQHPLGRRIGPRSRPFFEKKKRATGTVICMQHGDPHSSRLWYFGGGFKVEVNYPLGINAELLADQVSSRSTAVNGPMAPGLVEPYIVIAVKVTEEVGFTPFDSPVAESIDAYGKPWNNFVKRASPLVGLLATRRYLVRGCSRPSSIFSVSSHHL